MSHRIKHLLQTSNQMQVTVEALVLVWRFQKGCIRCSTDGFQWMEHYKYFGLVQMCWHQLQGTSQEQKTIMQIYSTTTAVRHHFADT